MNKSYVDTLDTIAGALSGFESALNAHDKYGMMTGISQVISALGSSPLGLGGAALANLPATSGLAIATNAAAGMMVAGKMLSDFQRDGKISYSDAIALAGNLANLAAAVAISLNPYAKVGCLVAFGITTGLEAGYRTYKDYESVINDWFKDIPFTIDLPDDASDRKRANGKYNDSKNWQPPRDPLVLDLNGGGIKTVGIGNKPILFDHNGDGIKTGTGWVDGAEGLLALDINGNGRIDSGRELLATAPCWPTGFWPPSLAQERKLYDYKH